MVVFALAACGGKPASPVVRLANCLNGKGFLVQPATGRVVGTSPGGVAFAVSTNGAIDDRGNPGDKRLSAADRKTIRACLH